MLSRSSAVCHPVLYSMLPVIPAFAARARSAVDLLERLLHFAFDAHDADQVLHHVLQFVLHGERILARRAALERSQRRFGGRIHLALIELPCPVFLGEFRGVLAGALAEHQQVGERIPAQAIRSVQTRRAFARREQARHGRHLRIAIHLNAAHDVVRRGTDFHRLLGDVEIGKLLELVIHAGQLFLDVLDRIRKLFFDPRDVEEHAAVRTARAPPSLRD